ncbi:iron-containing alcohol dehydrogenase [Tuberibacillus sp. Marseille-P3662]|uniref:iron-containing alcohol dehydrogenase n=1 Tax=Tuberibacillus sp. Marseille-P3662 TaxID=1965358 RepID=UPI000A1CE748|nr:iron-containing alcohol dehydrogenase [Tuberibacillus sp. Marseille-P3662]
MDTFVWNNPTKLIFGYGQTAELKNEVPLYGNKVLLVYGGGSIKKNGLYDEVVNHLKSIDVDIVELSGVEPNPRLSTIHKGVTLCKEHDVDFILAVGGGSVIDGSKTIAAGAKYDGDVWDFVSKKAKPDTALPLGTVLTLAATGSEMNSGAVVTNWETHEKYGWGSPLLFPKFSILDPANTYTVPENHTVYGIVDMMSHVLEQYYHRQSNTPLQEHMCEAVLKTVIDAAPKLLENLKDYEARETILYSGTIALNGMLQMGTRGDWGTHNLEHAVSAIYDIPHAGGLAILFPKWLKHIVDKGQGIDKTKQLAVRVFDVDPTGKNDQDIAIEGIDRLSAFWDRLGAPSRLADYDITDEKLDFITDHAMANGPFGGYKTMERQDVLDVLKSAL